MLSSLPFFLLITLFCINNARRAMNKGLNSSWWILFTIIAFMVGTFVMSFVLFVILVNKHPDVYSLIESNDQAGLNKFMMNEMNQHEILYPALIFAGGYGGYLFIRYLIEKRKDIPTQGQE